MAFYIGQAQRVALVGTELTLHTKTFVEDGDLELTGLGSHQALSFATVFAEFPNHCVGHA